MSRRPYKVDEILEIEWDDAATTQNWHSPDCKGLKKNDGLSRCNTVGYFLRETKRSIQVSKCHADDADRSDTQSIPIHSIRKVRRLR